MERDGRDGWRIDLQSGGASFGPAVQLFGVPEAVFADIAILRDGGQVDDYFVIHWLRPSKAPDVKVTLKASYLMCGPEPRFVLHGTEGSFVKRGMDPQEAALNAGRMPDTPDWGVEDESIWGLLHTEKSECRYPSVPGNYGGFYDERAISECRTAFDGCRRCVTGYPFDRSGMGGAAGKERWFIFIYS